MKLKVMVPRGKPPLPNIERAHDVRHLVVCAYARCRQLGDEREMITVKASDFQSTSDGRACYHGRCYAKKFGVPQLLRLPRKVLDMITLGDIGVPLMKAVLAKRRR